jgi:hypothetical protein
MQVTEVCQWRGGQLELQNHQQQKSKSNNHSSNNNTNDNRNINNDNNSDNIIWRSSAVIITCYGMGVAIDNRQE